MVVKVVLVTGGCWLYGVTVGRFKIDGVDRGRGLGL